jgi:hypothetical protein
MPVALPTASCGSKEPPVSDMIRIIRKCVHGPHRRLGWSTVDLSSCQWSLVGRRGQGCYVIGSLLSCDVLVHASFVRGVDSSVLHVCLTQLPKAEDTFGHKKEVAGNSFRCFQASQSHTDNPFICLHSNFLSTGTCWSFALERYQASRKEKPFVVDRIFIPITNSEA